MCGPARRTSSDHRGVGARPPPDPAPCYPVGVTTGTGSAAARLARSPAWQAVAGALVLALAFPSRLPGSLGLLALAGAAGIGVAWLWPRLPARVTVPDATSAAMFTLALVAGVGITTFWTTLARSPDWQMGDWGPQHAILARALPSLPGLHLPAWNQIVSTGDSPFELYPTLAYLITGHLALALHLTDDLPRAFMIVAVLVHVGLAVGTTALAMRVAPKPVALVVGIMTVLDSGAVAEGGTVDLFRWALLHSILALALFTLAAHGIVASLARPRLRSTIAIWIGTALAAIAHPAGLIVAVAAGLALVAVALLAHDVPARRAIAALVHLAVGVVLGAASWMPLADRILAYGQHFPNRVQDAGDLIAKLLAGAWPTTAFAVLVYAGFAGVLAGLWSRRAVPVFLAATTLALYLGLADSTYLAFDIAPGQAVARLGTVRLVSLVRPFLAASGAYAAGLLLAHARAGWRGASQRRRQIAAALVGIFVAALVRSLPAVWRTETARARATTEVLAPDRAGRRQLTEWATARAHEIGPGSFARALFETDTHEHFHLTALTGLPSFHLAPEPDMLLRERIEDASEASLRRFDVRWVIRQGESPELGDPATELAIGTYRIRTLPAWDGQFARIERGVATVRTLHLDDEAVTIEVTGTEPVLVALGTGFYPRWRAVHASGVREPVFALPTIAGGTLHVVSAWVAPGITTFTCDGPLPSDGKGTALTVLALLAAIGGAVAWRIPRLRRRALRWLARGHRALSVRGADIARIGVPVVLLALVVRGCVDRQRPARALEVGTGLYGGATVEARSGRNGADEWQHCGYSALDAAYSCPGLLEVHDGMVNLLNDAPPSWAFNTPGLVAAADVPGVEMRVTLDMRLGGRYWAGASKAAELRIDGERHPLGRAILSLGDGGAHHVQLLAAVPTDGLAITMVSEDTLVPPRAFLDGPPSQAPAAVRAIGEAR